MKKILLALILTAFIAGGLMVFATSVQAQDGILEGCTMTRDVEITDCPDIDEECLFSDEDLPCGVCCFVQTLYNVTDWIFVILIAVASLYVILGAMNLLMAAGEPEKVTKGRNYVMYAVIGLIVGFLARAIPAIVKLAVGV